MSDEIQRDNGGRMTTETTTDAPKIEPDTPRDANGEWLEVNFRKIGGER